MTLTHAKRNILIAFAFTINHFIFIQQINNIQLIQYKQDNKKLAVIFIVNTMIQFSIETR